MNRQFTTPVKAPSDFSFEYTPSARAMYIQLRKSIAPSFQYNPSSTLDTIFIINAAGKVYINEGR